MSTRKITAVVKYGNNAKETDKWQDESNPWTVTLRYQGRQMTVPFWTGSAWTHEPTAADVMDCLVSDATSVAFESFEGWCADMGYDTDSRKAERTYKACEETARQLRRFLGGDVMDVLEDSYRDDGELRRDDAGNVLVSA